MRTGSRQKNRAVLVVWALGLGLVVAACGSTKSKGFDGSNGSGASSGGNAGGSSSGSSSGGNSGSSSSGSGFSLDGGLGDGSRPVVVGPDPTTCAQAAMGHTYVGCDYWPTVTTNVVWSIFDFAVVVANAGAVSANITVTGPGAFSQTATAAPGGVVTLYLPWVANLKGPDSNECGGWAMPGTSDGSPGPLANSVLERGGAYHLVSSVPVTVYQFNALEYQGQGGPPGKDWSSCPGSTMSCNVQGLVPETVGCFSFTNDASLLLPSTALTGNVRVVSHPGMNPTPLSPPQSPAGSTYPGVSPFAAITATADNTTVTVTVSSTGAVLGSANGTDIAATNAGGVLKLTMNAGDVAELTGPQSDTSDLSGTLVQANHPIQVITGTSCINIPELAPACDHTEESNFPAETLGKDYVVVQPVGPAGSIVGHKVRIYGNVDGTHLAYSPSAPPGCPTTINAGQVVECGTPLGDACLNPGPFGPQNGGSCGAGNIVSQDFEVTGDHEFAVSTFSLGASLVGGNGTTSTQGDPDQSLATAVQQYRIKYVFLAPADYEENYAVVVAPIGTIVSIDGSPQPVSSVPVGSGGFSVTRIPLASDHAGAHELTASNPVGLQVMGYGAYTSYTYPGGSDLTLIAPPPPPPQ